MIFSLEGCTVSLSIKRKRWPARSQWTHILSIPPGDHYSPSQTAVTNSFTDPSSHQRQKLIWWIKKRKVSSSLDVSCTSQKPLCAAVQEKARWLSSLQLTQFERSSWAWLDFRLIPAHNVKNNMLSVATLHLQLIRSISSTVLLVVSTCSYEKPAPA